MVQKMYTPAHHITFAQAFRLYAFLSLYLFSILSFKPLSAQDITGLEIIRTLYHNGNYSVGMIDSYFDSTHQLIAYSISNGSGVKDTLAIYDFRRDSMLAKIPGYGLLSGISFINEAELLYVMKDTLWRVTGIGENISREALEKGIRSMRLSNDLSKVALVLYDNGNTSVGMAAYDTATGTLQTIDTIGSGTFSIDEATWLAFSPGGDYFALNGGYEQPYVYVVDVGLKTLYEVSTPGIESTYSPEFFFQRGKLKLAVGGGYSNGAIAVIDIASLTQEGVMPVYLHYNYAVAFDRTGRYMVCGGYDGVLTIFEVADTLFTEIESYEVGTLRSLHFTSDNQYLLSGYQASAGSKLDIQRIIRETSAVRLLEVLPLNLYPNPTSGKINIEGIQDVMVKVYNRAGQLILAHQEKGDGIDVSQLTPGYYIVIAENISATYIGRFVKE